VSDSHRVHPPTASFLLVIEGLCLFDELVEVGPPHSVLFDAEHLVPLFRESSGYLS